MSGGTPNLISITEDAQFRTELTKAGTKLVVVDFFATWCGPCTQIAPVVADYSRRYPRVVFFKVDVDQCQTVAQSEGVRAMPTFIFYRQGNKLGQLRGADPTLLEDKIKEYLGPEEADGDEEEVAVKGHMDLSAFITKAGCECLNESDDHVLEHCLTTKGGYLESDVDEQLIINVEFNQAVKLHSLRINGPEDKGPKTVKVFVNQPRTLDFDSAESMASLQTLELTPENLKDGALTQLKYVKFQNVLSITIFFKDNQAGTELTQIDYLGFIGSTLDTTNMAEFKRVAGKKGESH